MTARPLATSLFWVDLLALTKPRITVMTLVIAACGMLLAPTEIRVFEMVWALIGIALLVSGSSSFNMYLERRYDALMSRTRDRPLPSGRMLPHWALLLGWVLSLAAVPALMLGGSFLTTLLGVLSLVMYVLIYTPMKRWSCFSLMVGAVPGAMPALLGYTAAHGKLDAASLNLFVFAFLWQLPHFIAITIFRREEYTSAGYPVVAQIVGIKLAKWLMLITTFLLIGSSFVFYMLDVGGALYAIVALVVGIWFLSLCLQGFRARDENAWSKRVFFASLIYQVAIFAALGIDVLCKFKI